MTRAASGAVVTIDCLQYPFDMNRRSRSVLILAAQGHASHYGFPGWQSLL
jgi:hypothetical protein